MLAAGLVGHHELGTLIKSSSGREDGLALADGVVGGELLVTKLGPEVDKEGHVSNGYPISAASILLMKLLLAHTPPSPLSSPLSSRSKRSSTS